MGGPDVEVAQRGRTNGLFILTLLRNRGMGGLGGDRDRLPPRMLDRAPDRGPGRQSPGVRGSVNVFFTGSEGLDRVFLIEFQININM